MTGAEHDSTAKPITLAQSTERRAVLAENDCVRLEAFEKGEWRTVAWARLDLRQFWIGWVAGDKA
jgi:hypothetical protein